MAYEMSSNNLESGQPPKKRKLESGYELRFSEVNGYDELLLEATRGWDAMFADTFIYEPEAFHTIDQVVAPLLEGRTVANDENGYNMTYPWATEYDEILDDATRGWDAADTFIYEPEAFHTIDEGIAPLLDGRTVTNDENGYSPLYSGATGYEQLFEGTADDDIVLNDALINQLAIDDEDITDDASHTSGDLHAQSAHSYSTQPDLQLPADMPIYGLILSRDSWLNAKSTAIATREQQSLNMMNEDVTSFLDGRRFAEVMAVHVRGMSAAFAPVLDICPSGHSELRDQLNRIGEFVGKIPAKSSLLIVHRGAEGFSCNAVWFAALTSATAASSPVIHIIYAHQRRFIEMSVDAGRIRADLIYTTNRISHRLWSFHRLTDLYHRYIANNFSWDDHSDIDGFVLELLRRCVRSRFDESNIPRLELLQARRNEASMDKDDGPLAASEQRDLYNPTMVTIYNNLQLTTGQFSNVKNAARSYLTDPAHPDRMGCIGDHGMTTGSRLLTKYKMRECAEGFLNVEGWGDKCWGENRERGISDSTLSWPVDRIKIAATVIQLMRRVMYAELKRTRSHTSSVPGKHGEEEEVNRQQDTGSAIEDEEAADAAASPTQDQLANPTFPEIDEAAASPDIPASQIQYQLETITTPREMDEEEKFANMRNLLRRRSPLPPATLEILVEAYMAGWWRPSPDINELRALVSITSMNTVQVKQWFRNRDHAVFYEHGTGFYGHRGVPPGAEVEDPATDGEEALQASLPNWEGELLKKVTALLRRSSPLSKSVLKILVAAYMNGWEKPPRRMKALAELQKTTGIGIKKLRAWFNSRDDAVIERYGSGLHGHRNHVPALIPNPGSQGQVEDEQLQAAPLQTKERAHVAAVKALLRRNSSLSLKTLELLVNSYVTGWAGPMPRGVQWKSVEIATDMKRVDLDRWWEDSDLTVISEYGVGFMGHRSGKFAPDGRDPMKDQQVDHATLMNDEDALITEIRALMAFKTHMPWTTLGILIDAYLEGWTQPRPHGYQVKELAAATNLPALKITAWWKARDNSIIKKYGLNFKGHIGSTWTSETLE